MMLHGYKLLQGIGTGTGIGMVNGSQVIKVIGNR